MIGFIVSNYPVVVNDQVNITEMRLQPRAEVVQHSHSLSTRCVRQLNGMISQYLPFSKELQNQETL